MRIGLTEKNSVEYVEKLLRIWNSGNSAVLVDCDSPQSAAFSMLAGSGAAQCFADRTTADRYCDTAPPSFEMTCYPTEYGMPCVLPESVRDMYTPRYDENEAVVILSSGTTGKRKGISLSHRAISSNADSIIDYMNPSESDYIALRSESEKIIKNLVVFLPVRTTCIQRSLTMYRYFSRKGIATDFVAGVRVAPYSFHCWLMYCGEVIFDSPPDNRYYQLKTFKFSDFLGNYTSKKSF